MDCKGSSPRMRGSLNLSLPPTLKRGIIPAHAGLTLGATSNRSQFWDHPRACGAHYKFFACTRSSWGSSPRMRGSPTVDSTTVKLQGSSPRMRGSLSFESFFPQEYGIIPAHAGLTPTISRRATRTRDHPRACGAHKSASFLDTGVPGSSPRMRGSLFGFYDFKFHDGIIPAHAGLTQPFSKTHRPNRDHPRACGAHR